MSVESISMLLGDISVDDRVETLGLRISIANGGSLKRRMISLKKYR